MDGILMLKSKIVLGLGFVFITACGTSVITKNHYQGDNKNYVCTLPSGKQEVRKFTDLSVFSDCASTEAEISNVDTAPIVTADAETVVRPGEVALPYSVN